MKNPFDAIGQGYERALAGTRKRFGIFDHFWRAKERYGEVMGGRLAAAIAYYAFFAAFALALVAYSILGFAVGSDSDLKGSVSDYLAANLPWLKVEQIQDRKGIFAIFGFVGLVLTGVGWVDGLRSSQRLIWGLDEQPGNLVIRRLVDLGMLVGLGILLTLSLWITGGIEKLLLNLTPGYVTPTMQDVLSWSGVVLGWLVNLLLAAALLAAVPRLRMPPRRLLPSTVIVGTGISLLTTVGAFVYERAEDNPAYKVVGSVAGLLIFLYVFNQVLLFGASLASTSRHGRVMDLAAGPPPPEAAPSAPPQG